MVQLTLYSPKGNQGVRFFPYSGYLGLTPLRVEGVVRTKLDNDRKYLPAKSLVVSVRCYESRLGRLGVVQSNVLVDYSQSLWSKPDDRDWADIGDMEFPFRISLPAKVAGFSTANFQDYRVFWRIEAVLNHIHLSGVGSRQFKHFELPLIRYDLPPLSPPPSPAHLDSQTSKLRAPTIRYRVSTPTSPVGPLDLVSVPLFLQPLDSSVSIRSASLIVERRLHLHETNSIPSPQSPTSASPSTPSQLHPQASTSSSLQAPLPVQAPPATSYPDSNNNHLYTNPHSLTNYRSNPPSPTPSPSPSPSILTDSDSRPLLPHHPSVTSSAAVSPSVDVPSKIAVTSVAGAESSGRFSRDSNGIWTKTLTLQWPAVKSSSRWAMGETMHTSLVSVRFFIRVKIIVSSPGGTETIELAEQEITVVSTNDAERQLAISKYNELQYNSRSRSKSKSPRRSRRDREQEIDQLPSPPSSPPTDNVSAPPGLTMTRPKYANGAESSHPPSRSSAAHAHSSSTPYPHSDRSKNSIMKRPHTSAGPRDKPSTFGVGMAYLHDRGHRREDDYTQRVMMAARPDTAVDRRGAKQKGAFGQKWLVAPSLGGMPSSSRSSASGLTESSSPEGSSHGHGREILFKAVDQVQVRAWEEELARIELQSRRSSADMLACKRKRTTES